jgi:hypothetical protein
MPTKTEVLAEKTFKGEVEELEARVYYTLSQTQSLQAHRNSKAIALLVKLLYDKDQLSGEEIDNLLLELV